METDFDSRRVGLAVRVLEIETRRCGWLTRRYLEYAPPSVAGKTNPAIWILLHDTHESAETMRTEETRWYFDALAEREGFVVVYANAAPGLDTDPKVPNSGGWQTSERSSPHVDDDLYLERVVGGHGAGGGRVSSRSVLRSRCFHASELQRAAA
jgi:poly(3-hydroxybutyrate) depolymerase